MHHSPHPNHFTHHTWSQWLSPCVMSTVRALSRCRHHHKADADVQDEAELLDALLRTEGEEIEEFVNCIVVHVPRPNEIWEQNDEHLDHVPLVVGTASKLMKESRNGGWEQMQYNFE